MDQPVNGSRVAQVVKTRLPARTALAPYGGHETQAAEGSLDDLVVSSPAIAKTKDGRVRIVWVPPITVAGVLPQHSGEVCAEWNQA
jgi:hypothetical protein